MRAFWLLLVGCSLSAPATSAIYRHVDDAGNVTYSDRPQHPHQEALQLPPPNVATPEARRQLELARQASLREEQAETNARVSRWAAAQRVTPASYGRTLSPSRRAFAVPAFYSYPVTFNARTPAQGNSSQGLRSSGFSHRAHHTRR